MKHLNTLPDLVLRLIFSKLPLVDLLTAARVCHLWKAYQTEISTKVRSLTLLVGHPDAESLITESCFTHKYRHLLRNEDGTRIYLPQHLHSHYHHKYESFSYSDADELVRIFPNVSTLEIALKLYVSKQFVLGQIVALLRNWSPVLKSLKIYMQFNKGPNYVYLNDDTEYVNLFAVFNSMPQLEHLTLDSGNINGVFCYLSGLNGSSFSLDLPILGQLREFYFASSEENLRIFEKSFNDFAAQNENLKQIGLECKIFTFGSTFDQFHLKYPQLTSKIAFIQSFNLYSPKTTILSDSLSQFSSLTYLHYHEDFNCRYNPRNHTSLLGGTLNSVSSLPNLRHLHITTYMHFFRAPTSEESRVQLSQFSSVQVLTISTDLPPNTSFESVQWAYLFPEVQVLELFLDLSFSKNPYLFLSKQQLQRTLSPFVQCSKLHRLYTHEKLFMLRDDYPQCNEWIVMQVRDRKIIIKVEKFVD